MFKELETLIPPPGHFIVLDPTSAKPVKQSAQKNALKSKKLDIPKEPTSAKRVYATYATCWNNAVRLLDEARLLFQNGRYARVVALAITAWEELGKSQIAADYYTGVLSEAKYKEAFKNHRFKTSYLARTGLIDGSQKFKVGFNPIIGERLENIRQNALYASETNDPEETFSKKDAVFVLQRVWQHRQYIHYAEELNGRIGSKALFK